jgi:hypothetical protein
VEDRGAGIDSPHILLDRLRIANFGAGEDNQISALECGAGFALAARWKKVSVRKLLGDIQRDDIYIALERPMLEPVVQKVNIHLKALFRQLPAAVAVCTDDDRNLREHSGEQRRLIAYLARVHVLFAISTKRNDVGAATAAITTRENAGPEAVREQPPRDVSHERRLPCAAGGDVANAHDGPTEPTGLEPATTIRGAPQGDSQPESRSQGYQ